MISTFLTATGIITLAEMGDKTQLLAFMLAARFKRPLPIVLGILAATLLNHTLAGLVGVWITHQLSPVTLRWILGIGFLAMAIWTLIPDKIDGPEALPQRFGIFITTLFLFFMAEMGDKTQIATIGMAAHFHDTVLVVIGTTLGMMIADVPAIWIGNSFAHRLPLNWIRRIAAGSFALIGITTLLT